MRDAAGGASGGRAARLTAQVSLHLAGNTALNALCADGRDGLARGGYRLGSDLVAGLLIALVPGSAAMRSRTTVMLPMVTMSLPGSDFSA